MAAPASAPAYDVGWLRSHGKNVRRVLAAPAISADASLRKPVLLLETTTLSTLQFHVFNLFRNVMAHASFSELPDVAASSALLRLDEKTQSATIVRDASEIRDGDVIVLVSADSAKRAAEASQASAAGAMANSSEEEQDAEAATSDAFDRKTSSDPAAARSASASPGSPTVCSCTLSTCVQKHKCRSCPRLLSARSFQSPSEHFAVPRFLNRACPVQVARAEASFLFASWTARRVAARPSRKRSRSQQSSQQRQARQLRPQQALR